MPFDTALLGQPVELPQIGRELKKLWEAAGGTKSRASLVNFAVYCEGAEALEENTRLISEFTRRHACRALLIAQAPTESGARTQAWINAHCHLARAGAKQVCCEQITFALADCSQDLLANLLFAHLDSDLPLYLWWRGDLRPPLNLQLWRWVDRLIYDSSAWTEPRQQLETVRELAAAPGARLTLCDLEWTRTLHFRQALAQMFDHPECLARIASITRLSLTHAPGHCTAAVLFTAWVASQLGWTQQAANGQTGFYFAGASGGTIEVVFQEAAGAPVSCCEAAGEAFSIAILREGASRHLRADVTIDARREFQHLLPASADDLTTLLDEELTLGGRHKVYQRALAAAIPLL